MTAQERLALRKRLKRAAKESEREYVKFQRLADQCRTRWALLFQAFIDAKTFNFDKEAE